VKREELHFTPIYYLDESDPDIVILRRQDGSLACAFSAMGATKVGIIERSGRTTGHSSMLIQLGEGRLLRSAGALNSETRLVEPTAQQFCSPSGYPAFCTLRFR
jgi:hypothetical protein